MEAPAVALGVERLVGAMRLVGAIAPDVVAQPGRDPCTRADRALIVRIDVVDVHADVLALDAATLRADRAMVTLRADSDRAGAELEHRVVDRAVPIGSSRAAATLWYERSSHANSRSASRSPSGRDSIASATRGKSTWASSAAPLRRLSAGSSLAAIRALARSRRASPRRCLSNRFEPIPYNHGSALARDASNVLRRSNAIRNSSPTSPSATSAPTRRPRKRSRVAAWRS